MMARSRQDRRRIKEARLAGILSRLFALARKTGFRRKRLTYTFIESFATSLLRIEQKIAPSTEREVFFLAQLKLLIAQDIHIAAC